MKKEDYEKKLSEKDIIIENYKRELRLMKQQLEYYKTAAYTDSLTKLNNRRSIENLDDFDSVILGDIDHFKIINDKYGHALGDQVLIEISKVLKDNIRQTDLVCRWGGEEFVVFLKNCTEEAAYSKAITLKEKISELSEKFGFEITMSFGVSKLSEGTMENAIKEADSAMYLSKQNGRNRVTIYS